MNRNRRIAILSSALAAYCAGVWLFLGDAGPGRRGIAPIAPPDEARSQEREARAARLEPPPPVPRKTERTSRDATEVPPVRPRPAAEPPDAGRPAEHVPVPQDARAEAGRTVKVEGRRVHDLHAEGTIILPPGVVSIDGDVRVGSSGGVAAAQSTLVLDGHAQTIEGNLTASRVILRGGTKRIRGGTFGTAGEDVAKPGEADLVVEAGTTLLIEKDGKWNTPNPYGFQIAGNLVIDGGEFHCRFSNGTGKENEDSWLPGSTLEVFSGKFVGDGDADFSGARITLHDGSLEIDDDIWNSGDSLDIRGGLMRNTTGGGMFNLTGVVSLRGGKLQAFQSAQRGLRIHRYATVFCTGGEIAIAGSAATAEDGGLLLGASATLPSLVIETSTRIHKDSTAGAYLSVGGDLRIAKGHRFEARGFRVIATFTPSEDQGEFVP